MTNISLDGQDTLKVVCRVAEKRDILTPLMTRKLNSDQRNISPRVAYVCFSINKIKKRHLKNIFRFQNLNLTLFKRNGINRRKKYISSVMK